MEKPDRWSGEQQKRFAQDMIDGGLEPYHYRGRHFWNGPAVNVDSVHDAMKETRVDCQFDALGLGFVVYPNATEGE